MRIAVAIEATPKKSFATAVDWPGWSRSAKTEALAVEALAAYAERYSAVARFAGEAFRIGVLLDFDVVERGEGDASTDFGVPGRVRNHDRRAVSATAADRLARIVATAWQTLAIVGKNAPEALRKGPRGGGRDTSKILLHVAESDLGYATVLGLMPKVDASDPAAVAGVRHAMLDLLRQPSDGEPIAGRKWPPRYAAHRIAWHALDHAWEIEDRTEPAG